MGSNRFYLNVVLNCLLIFASAFLLFYFLMYREQYATATGFGILGLFLCLRLIYYVNRTNRLLQSFLSYMQEKDPSLVYARKYVNRNFAGLQNELDKLLREFRDQRLNLEVQAHYLEAILDNVSTGILCYDDDANIRNSNRAAVECLGNIPLHKLEEIDSSYPGLSKRILAMKPGEQLTESELLIQKSSIRLKNENIRIIALHDISQQMEEQEIRSWKKLIRVINHEIMNSMTPIITLALAIRKKLTREKDSKSPGHISEEDRLDAVKSTVIIQDRSAGLVSFIERYKKVTTLPDLKPENLLVDELFNSIYGLFEADLKKRSIKLVLESECKIKIQADRQMMEQVLINLVKNAADALQDQSKGFIKMSCSKQAEQVLLSIEDNGEGISQEKQEQAFVPFISTRKKGSGIGLSLCRQIIRLHQGQIYLNSVPGEGTTVNILL